MARGANLSEVQLKVAEAPDATLPGGPLMEGWDGVAAEEGVACNRCSAQGKGPLASPSSKSVWWVCSKRNQVGSSKSPSPQSSSVHNRGLGRADPSAFRPVLPLLISIPRLPRPSLRQEGWMDLIKMAKLALGLAFKNAFPDDFRRSPSKAGAQPSPPLCWLPPAWPSGGSCAPAGFPDALALSSWHRGGKWARGGGRTGGQGLGCRAGV